MTWSISYRDGSANAYHFAAAGDGATFEYVPVRPEQSSTGLYSGGDPRSGPLDAETVATLWRHVRTFEADRTLHVADRAKGTGAFTITDDGGTRSFIIVRGPALLAFDSFAGGL